MDFEQQIDSELKLTGATEADEDAGNLTGVSTSQPEEQQSVANQAQLNKADSGANEGQQSLSMSIGQLIDARYEVQAHLGSGGMGEVYKVLDRDTQVVYALKMLSPGLAEKKVLSKRLEQEAQAARTLVHGNIVGVYDVGKTADGSPYLLMDYIEGNSLESVLKKEVFLPPNRAISIFVQIAEALVHARQKGIVHRDLKPSNILLAKTESGGDMVKIVDFGIAKIADSNGGDRTKLTQTGELMGTPLYMSPEQCVGDELDERSDIYSFGCVMYEVLTGKSPFAAENSVKIILNHLSDKLVQMPSTLNIPSDLKEVIRRCLKKNRFERYQSAVDLHIDLERVASAKKIKPFRRRLKISRPVGIAMVLILLIGILSAGGIGYWWMQHTPGHSHQAYKPYKYLTRSLAEWTNLIEQEPDKAGLYVNRGHLHAMRAEYTDAIDDFSHAIDLDKQNTDAYVERSTLYAVVGR